MCIPDWFVWTRRQSIGRDRPFAIRGRASLYFQQTAWLQTAGKQFAVKRSLKCCDLSTLLGHRQVVSWLFVMCRTDCNGHTKLEPLQDIHYFLFVQVCIKTLYKLQDNTLYSFCKIDDGGGQLSDCTNQITVPFNANLARNILPLIEQFQNEGQCQPTARLFKVGELRCL